jgi:DNA primase
LPEGKDPDEVILEGPSQWARLIAEAKPVMDFYFDALTADLDLSTAKGKSEATGRLGPLVAELVDRVQRQHYLQHLGRMVQVDERTLWHQIRRTAQPSQPRRVSPSKPVSEPSESVALGLGEHCLSFLLVHPGLLGQVDEALVACEENALAVEDLNRPEDRELLAAWQSWLYNGGEPQAKGGFYDTLDDTLQGRVGFLVGLQENQPPAPDALLAEQVLAAVMLLRLRSLKQRAEGLRFLQEDAQAARDREASREYGHMTINLTRRIRRLEQCMNARSLAGRRREDAEPRELLLDL